MTTRVTVFRSVVSRSTVSRALTVALMAAMLWAFGHRRRPIGGESRASVDSSALVSSRPPMASESGGAPESAVWGMVEAARVGDPARYLECYTGDLERRLRKDFEGMGPARSREYLLDAHRHLKGVAVRPPRVSSRLEAQIPVEYVYDDRNEVQQVYVRKVGGSWKIDRVDGAERVKTLVPYGTPVER